MTLLTSVSPMFDSQRDSNRSKSTGGTVGVVSQDVSILPSLRVQLERRGIKLHAFETTQGLVESLVTDWQRACAVLDYRLPEGYSLGVLDRLAERRRAAPVIFIAQRVTVPEAVMAMKRGAYDLLIAPVPPVILADRVLEALSADEKGLQERHNHLKAAWRLSKLTPRERQVVLCLLNQLSSQQIAELLSITPKTVDAHRGNAMRKLELRGIVDLVRTAILAGWEFGDLPWDVKRGNRAGMAVRVLDARR